MSNQKSLEALSYLDPSDEMHKRWLKLLQKRVPTIDLVDLSAEIEPFNSHKRQQTLRDLFNCGYDVINLEIGQASEPTKEPKRRLTPKNRHAPKRRLTPNKRDETRKRRKIDDEDSADTNLEHKF